MKDAEVFNRGEKAAKIGFIIVAVLGVVKGIVGYVSRSVALQAQALDSLTDLVSLIAVYMGLRVSRKPPNERFSYGYYRVETLVSLFIAIIILATGGFMLIESGRRVLSPQPINDPFMVIGVSGFSIPVLLWLRRYTNKVGVEINSQAVKSQSEDFLTDVYSSVVVLAGVGGSWLGFPVLEGLSGVVISLLIIRVGLFLNWSSLLVLMDAVENPDRLLDVKRLAESVHGVVEAKSVRLRRSGPFCMGEVTIRVAEELSVDKAHRLSHLVEDAVKREVSGLESLVIHIEPVKREKHRLALPVKADNGLDSVVSTHFGSAPFFIFVDLGLSGVERWYSKINSAVDLEKKRGVMISDLLVREDVTAVISDELGEGPFHILRDSFVGVYQIKGGFLVRDAVDLFVLGKLEPRVLYADPN